MKNKDGGEGGGLINFPSLKRGGGAYLRGRLNRGFAVFVIEVIVANPNRSYVHLNKYIHICTYIQLYTVYW